jgi:glycosyltransferase involved in cell wall biosynthesis
LVDLYKSNDRFLYWTALDNYPTVILEAMAYGMKVFVNNYESFRYFLDNNIIYENEERMIRGIFSNRVSNAQLASSHNVFAEINLHIE